ncbi:Protein Wnt-4 [Eumeta japonica]|uniref:Protein Wnt n=1 Tax=Eumeta variegata TaxID=151549 RepID=A0A4C1X796_EUMVA|nr:Protein Wnt-4 [Eumeta japonica]
MYNGQCRLERWRGRSAHGVWSPPGARKRETRMKTSLCDFTVKLNDDEGVLRPLAGDRMRMRVLTCPTETEAPITKSFSRKTPETRKPSADCQIKTTVDKGPPHKDVGGQRAGRHKRFNYTHESRARLRGGRGGANCARSRRLRTIANFIMVVVKEQSMQSDARFGYLICWNKQRCGTREQAYVYAISAAALTWTVARACAAGALPACSCAAPPAARPRPPRHAAPAAAEPHVRFKWGGCGDNFKWADKFAKQFLDMHEIDVRDGRTEEPVEMDTTTTAPPFTTTATTPTTAPPIVILVDDQPAVYNASVAPPGLRRKGRRGRKRLPRSPRRGRPTRKRFRSRYDVEPRGLNRGSRYRDLEYRMAADDPRFDPHVDVATRLARLRPLIATANLINIRFGRKTVSVAMRTKCTCHGVSGSCSVRTCWRALPPLARVAAELAAEAERAGPLRPRRHARPHARPRLRYVTPSPDYCEPDPAAGSLGTHGR